MSLWRGLGFAAFFAALPAFPGTLSVRLLDEEGAPCPARVYLQDANRKPVTPPGVIVYRRTRGEISEEHFVPPSGSFEIELPEGSFSLEVERGKEFTPARASLAIPASGRVERTIRLSRWIRMRDQGWYSGDMHPHRPLRDLPALMEAEDLNAALPITRWRALRRPLAEDPDLRAVLEKADGRGIVQLGRHRWFAALNEELEPLSAALLSSQLGREGSPLQYPLPAYGLAVRGRGGLVDSEKATSLELPAIAAAGACDVVGLANNHIWRTGYFTAPWGAWPDRMLRSYPPTCQGFVLAGFEMYYALLNMGFKLKLSAGSASGVHPVPPGWSRVYAHVRGEFSAEAWFEAVRAGRAFVTSGPMLLLRVNGLEPGSEFRGSRVPGQVVADIRVLSKDPVSEAELVVNGAVSRVALRRDSSRPIEYRGSARLKLAGSSWIAARWMAGREGGCDLAHTAPVYFWNGEDPIPVPRGEAAFLLESVEKLIVEAETGKTAREQPTTLELPDPAVREETLRQLRRARDVYKDKLRQAR